MRVFVLGATGFIGSHVVDRLVADGHEVVGVARHEKAFARFAGRVTAVTGDIMQPTTWRDGLRGCDASINLVGLIRERRGKGLTYERVVVQGTRDWLEACEKAGVKRVVYVSAIGARADGTPYQRTKWAAEQSVQGSKLEWTIVRPSFVSGEDGAIPALAKLMRLKLVPVWGRQDYRFEPVDVDDVAGTIVRSLKSPRARNRVYELGGPDRLTYKEMLRAIARAKGRKPWLIPAPWFVAYTIGALLGWLPFFPATLENFRLLRQGSVAADQEWAKDLKIEPRPFAESLATHLRRRGR